MKLDARIVDDLKTAMKGGDRLRIDTLRMVRSRIQEATVKRRGEEGRDALLTDDDVTQVIAAYAKQRRDSIASYRDAGGSQRDSLRDDLQIFSRNPHKFLVRHHVHCSFHIVAPA